jgi:phosphatidylethanolamine/phosphatidyl-N-methylethanolamine N-methyltransferase
VRAPLKVGAVAPSSRMLARMMVAGLTPGDRVVELGPGTGTFTRAILDCGVAPEDLYLVERSDGFTNWLQERFPGTHVVCGDAVDMSSLLSDLQGQIDVVISGLPLLLFSGAQKAQLVAGAFSLLAPGGSLVQFTYGGRCPVSRSHMRELGLQARMTGVTPFNIPPAFVYRLERRPV